MSGVESKTDTPRRELRTVFDPKRTSERQSGLLGQHEGVIEILIASECSAGKGG
jgi:hypothetical protein